MNETIEYALGFAYDQGRITGSEHASALDELKADARALWAYRVAMAVGKLQCDEHDKCPTPEVMHPGGPGWAVCWTVPGERVGRIYSEGHTPEEAMLNFAEAVFPTLPADVRAKLGERP
jgi:hypothetical protein